LQTLRKHRMTHWTSTLSSTPIALNPCTHLVSESGGQSFYLSASEARPHLWVAQLQGLAVTFEGWLYNETKLRKELGVNAKTNLAALLLEAYRRWGEGFLLRLEGAFALCLWDGREKTFLAARDALGVYPLFYAKSSSAWFFSPWLESLRQHPSISSKINRGAVAAHLLNWNRDIQETLYEEIKRVPPGHFLKVQPHKNYCEVSRYWSPLPNGKPTTWLDEDALEQFPALMKRSIGNYLQLGKAAIYLSGGLDSGSVSRFASEYANEHHHPSPHAFSLVFDDPEANEERIQRGVAEGLGIPHTIVPINLTTDPVQAFFDSLDLNETWPQPLASTFRSVYLSLGQRAKAEGNDLVLTGDGGDEWLAIHHTLAADFMTSLDTTQLRHLFSVVGASHAYSSFKTSKHVLWDYGLRLLLIDRLASSLQHLTPQFIQHRRTRLLDKSIPDWLATDPALRSELLTRLHREASGAKSSFYEQEVVAGTLEHPLTVLYMEESFESSQRIGIPILKPFYDPEVIRFLVQLPPHLRSLGGRFKGLLRHLLHERFPQLGFDRQEKPYATNFFGTMVLEGVKRSWSETNGVGTLAELGIVNAAPVREGITTILNTGKLQNPKNLWILLCTEHWVRSRMSV
jgi:asparagine synthase (glutamine-hydrolysing)